jgi:hypothetical protein
MSTRCRLCQRWVPSDHGVVRCVCGWSMDPACAEAHGEWCPRGTKDKWIGTLER